ncbi:baeRF3 domain-containing protein [Chitinophaga lutea]
MLQETLFNLGKEKGTPCVTISMAGHRTHPDNLQDEINLKNLAREAETRILSKYDKRSVALLLENLDNLVRDFDHNHNEEGMYIFVSAETRETLKTKWPPAENKVYVDDQFALKDIIKAYNRTAHYYILHLSQQGAQLFEASDDRIAGEVRQHGFPFKDNPFYITDQLKGSDPKAWDKMTGEFFNRVDKAVVEAHKADPLPVIVAGTQENYGALLSQADQRGIYAGHITVNPHASEPLHLSEAAFETVKALQQDQRSAAIDELMQAVPAGRVLTDLQEIYRAAYDGRGELLLVNPDYHQAVDVTPKHFELVEDGTTPRVVDDIVNEIAWEIVQKKGRVYFTAQPKLEELGQIALKVRY